MAEFDYRRVGEFARLRLPASRDDLNISFRSLSAAVDESYTQERRKLEPYLLHGANAEAQQAVREGLSALDKIVQQIRNGSTEELTAVQVAARFMSRGLEKRPDTETMEFLRAVANCANEDSFRRAVALQKLGFWGDERQTLAVVRLAQQVSEELNGSNGMAAHYTIAPLADLLTRALAAPVQIASARSEQAAPATAPSLAPASSRFELPPVPAGMGGKAVIGDAWSMDSNGQVYVNGRPQRDGVLPRADMSLREFIEVIKRDYGVTLLPTDLEVKVLHTNERGAPLLTLPETVRAFKEFRTRFTPPQYAPSSRAYLQCFIQSLPNEITVESVRPVFDGMEEFSKQLSGRYGVRMRTPEDFGATASLLFSEQFGLQADPVVQAANDVVQSKEKEAPPASEWKTRLRDMLSRDDVAELWREVRQSTPEVAEEFGNTSRFLDAGPFALVSALTKIADENKSLTENFRAVDSFLRLFGANLNSTPPWEPLFFLGDRNLNIAALSELSTSRDFRDWLGDVSRDLLPARTPENIALVTAMFLGGGEKANQFLELNRAIRDVIVSQGEKFAAYEEDLSDAAAKIEVLRALPAQYSALRIEAIDRKNIPDEVAGARAEWYNRINQNKTSYDFGGSFPKFVELFRTKRHEVDSVYMSLTNVWNAKALALPEFTALWSDAEKPAAAFFARYENSTELRAAISSVYGPSDELLSIGGNLVEFARNGEAVLTRTSELASAAHTIRTYCGDAPQDVQSQITKLAEVAKDPCTKDFELFRSAAQSLVERFGVKPGQVFDVLRGRTLTADTVAKLSQDSDEYTRIFSKEIEDYGKIDAKSAEELARRSAFEKLLELLVPRPRP